ncbi:uncharacterized protein LOC117779727 [Drosophila innubila]|uniref:uncharacterized protein LOC117779727 n=1 Tax=Drosophila innubila TaxID=198719 RepID=UPI00148D15F0|nr:uncharacterized protein LOC117779727 [Drosophila innubila]
MSYLLTEIALEMLGYKFYDTNGVFHLTNFQQSMAAVQNDVHPDEPSLTEFIDQPSNSVTTKNGHTTNIATPSAGPSSSMVPSTTSAISVDMRRTPIRALAKMMANEGDKTLNGHEQQHPKQLYSSVPLTVLPKMSTKPRRPPTKALTRILQYESVTVRCQISQRLEASLRQSVTTNKETQQKECLILEKKKILEDADEVHKFRLFLEERLRHIDPRPYATYQRTFTSE